MNRDNLIEEMFGGLQALNRRMLSKGRTSLSSARIGQSQLLVLALIESGNGISIKSIASALGISSSAATQFVNELESKRYLMREKDAKDQRVTTVHLSSKGKKELSNFKKESVQFLKEHLALFTDAEFKQYLALMKKLISRSQGV